MPTKELVLAAHAYIHDIVESEGPFDGVIGFSQGAALAASLMLERSKSATKGDLFSFAIFACASLPFDIDNNHGLTAWLQARRKGSNDLVGEFDGELSKDDPPGFPSEIHQLDERANLLGRYHPARTQFKINVPTVHIIGDADPYRGQGVALSQLSLRSESAVVHHKEGHCIPRDRVFQTKAIRAINTAIDRASFYRH
jgi:pimeloyl-ACP methyl ester carboxylesterase